MHSLEIFMFGFFLIEFGPCGVIMPLILFHYIFFQTSQSLSERFGTGASAAGDASQEGRKVFF